MTQLRIEVLGPVRVMRGDASRDLHGSKPALVLAILASALDREVSTDSLIDGLWGDEPPPTARKAVQVHVSTLRRTLGEDGPLLTSPRGYVLQSADITVDAAEFAAIIKAAPALCRTSPAVASDRLSAALAMWRGPCFGDLQGKSVLLPEVARLDEMRIRASELRIGAELLLGHHADLLGELETLTTQHPFREALTAQFILALYRSSRQAEALRVFARARETLAEELGIEPSALLRNLERQVLEQAVELEFVERSDVERLGFLVTEIVDSASLWEQDADRMAKAVAVHDEILGKAVARHDGRVFKHTGDGILAVFGTAANAASAGAEAIASMHGTRWPTIAPLIARMAFDEGPAEQQDDDFYGPVLNRVMRVMSSGHGGQLLTTEYALRSTPLPSRHLGEIEFRGIGRVNVHQVTVGSLEVEHPDLRPDRSPPAVTRAGMTRAIRGYELREQLGEGDFGIVYRAYQASVGREVTVKVIRPEFANQPTFIKRFEAEAQFVAQLEHPHIVSLYDYWRDPEGACLVMPYLRGGSLARAIDVEPPGVPTALRLIEQVGSALAYAHRQGVIHRDIRPGNVLLDDDGNAYLSDFGIAANHVGRTEAPVMTSVAYMAPEEFAGNPTDQRSDIYCLGLLAYEVLTGNRPPLGGQPRPMSDVRPELSAAVDRVLAIACAADPEDRHTRVEDFMRALRQALGADGPAVLGMLGETSVRNPYKGLRAFGETDARDFYGRAALTTELLASIRAQTITVAVGPSGSGKSSLAKAGVIPAVRGGALGAEFDWLVAEMYPGSFPFEELEAALMRVAVERPDGLLADLEMDERGLARVSKQILPHDDARLLLVIDQFEELFSLTPDAAVRTRFLDTLVAVAEDERSRVRVLATMRSDFLDGPLVHPEFGEIIRRGLVAVAMPGRDSLALGVSGPASDVGLELEAGLVTEIVRDVVDQPGGLPLMQHTLSEMVDQRRGSMLTIESYRQTGGVVGALARRAEEVYDSLSEPSRTAARQIFLRLVRADRTSEDTRRRVRRSELESLGLERTQIEGVLQEFGRFRLLSFDRDPVTRGPTVEVAHESLIRTWPRLRGWVDGRREDILLERRLDAAVVEWNAHDRGPGYLLREARLAHFEAWAEGTDVRMTRDERDLLQASRDHADAVLVRARRRRSVVVSSLAGLTVLALLLAAFAFRQRNDARISTVRAQRSAEEAQRSAELAQRSTSLAQQQAVEAERLGVVARAKELAAVAQSTSLDDPELGIHIALEAQALSVKAGEDIAEVTSALYATTSADRITHRFTNEGVPEWFFVAGGLADINAQATQALQSRPGPGLFPNDVDVIDLQSRDVLATISDQTGLSGFQWDPVTGEILTLSLGGELSWYDPETFTQIRVMTLMEGSMFPHRVGDVISYAVLTNEAELDLQTHVVDANSGELRFSGPPDAFIGRVSPSGRYVAIVDDLRLVRTFDLSTGDPVSVISIPGSGVLPGNWTWAADRDVVFVGQSTATMYELDPLAGAITRQRLVASTEIVAPSPDGRYLAIAGIRNEIHLVATDTLTVVDDFAGHSSTVNSLSWSQDGRTLVSADTSGASIVWDLGETTTSAGAQAALRDGPLFRFDLISADRIALSTLSGEVELRDPRTGGLIASWESVEALSTGRASPNGATLAVATGSSITFADTADGAPLLTTADNLNHVPLAFSPDSSLLATSAIVPTFALRDISGYAVIDARTTATIFASEGDGESLRSTSAAFTSDSSMVAFAIDTRTPAEGEHGEGLGGVAPTPIEGSFRLHDATSGELLADVALPSETFTLVISPDNSKLAVSTTDGWVHLYDLDLLRAGAGEAALIGQAFTDLFGLVFSEDSKLIISGSPGALTARSANAALEIRWVIDLRAEQPTTVRIGNGMVWTTMLENVFRGQSPMGGIAGYPLDIDDLVAFARSKLSRDLTEAECHQYLRIDCGDRAAARPIGSR